VGLLVLNSSNAGVPTCFSQVETWQVARAVALVQT
jgi:hypothetical protein